MCVRNSITATILPLVLIVVACTTQPREQRSQRFYADELCSSALSADHIDTLYERAYLNFSVTSNDPTIISALVHECNIKNVSAEVSSFVRQLFTLNEMPTDVAMCAWDDAGISNICFNQVDKIEGNLKPAEGMYMRLICGVLICNKYLHLYSRNEKGYDPEIRFLRALNYYYLLDLFGKAPIFRRYTDDFVDVATSKELYEFIEEEINAIIPFLKDGKNVTDFDEGTYGRANKIAAHMLLARLYLNAEVYTGEAQWAKAKREAQAVIAGPYKLSRASLYNASMNTTWNGYQLLFVGDNGVNGANNEMIFPIRFDSQKIADRNGSTYLICSSSKFDTRFLPDIEGLGVKDKWIGNRVRANLAVKFLRDSIPYEAYHPTMIEWAHDDRALFQSVDRRLSCKKRPVFEDGFSSVKFNDFRSASPYMKTESITASTDFPLMRLAEAYLTLAEAEWRLGDTKSALENINIIRERAHAIPMESIDAKGYQILDEWAREFYFEGRRRSDLIRFGCFGGENDYLWQWKGGTILGRNFGADQNYYKLPIDTLIKPLEKTHLDMYYLIGDGIGDGSWSTEGGDNVGKGIVPMSIIDKGVLQFTDYMPQDVGFKMLRDFDSWEEQFGAGEYPGDVEHNNGGSKHFTVPAEGIYKVTLVPHKKTVEIKPVEDQSVKANENIFLWVNHGKQEMVRYSEVNKKTHVWRADFSSEGGDIMINMTKTASPIKNPINLTTSKRYGIPSDVDNRGRIVLHTREGQQTIRVIYNDIDNSLYTYQLEDMKNPEDEIPEDIKLQLVIDRENKVGGNAYALKYSFKLSEQAEVKKVRLGLVQGNSKEFGQEICTNKDGLSNQDGTAIVQKDMVQKVIDQLPSSPVYKFAIEVEFNLYGDVWTARSYSSTFYL